MMKINDKLEKLTNLLDGPWISYEQVSDGIKVTGLVQLDFVIIEMSDFDLILKLLKSTENKRIFGAIKILSFFGVKAKPYLKEMTKKILDFNENEQNEILQSMRRIEKKTFLVEMAELIEMNPPFEFLFNIIFFVSELLEEYPINGLFTILKCSNNKEMWELIKDYLRTGINKLEKTYDPKTELISKFEREPPIGISQDMETKRIQRNLIQDNINKALRKIDDLITNEKTTESKQAKKAIKSIKNKIW
ncbi:MAG: hypothetical protein JXA54_12355 [Candidatus Heimdallarchaeota archaeon]|nr:hypothetical protein [Candidatus Heimdallarchaeota archaeon]